MIAARSLSSAVVGGVMWSGVARAGQQAIGFAITVVLVRLLLPSAFGLIAMASVFIGLARLIADVGLGAALVQRTDESRAIASSVFWLTAGLGALLSGGFYLLAPVVAGLYDEPVLESLARLLGLTFLISALGIIPRSLLQRRLAFKDIAGIELGAEIIAGLCAVAAALTGFGMWSLAVQALASSALNTTMSTWRARWLPQLHFHMNDIRELANFGLNLTGFQIVNYCARNADNFLIGRFLGAHALGLYSRAYSFLLLPITHITGVLSRVMFPALSSIRTDPARVRRIYLRAMGAVATLAFPTMTGLLVTADVAVEALFGAQWLSMVTAVRVLCLVGILQVLMNPNGWLYSSQGRTDIMLRWGIVASALAVASFVLGVWIGTIEAVAMCYLAANAITVWPSLWLSGRLVSVTPVDVLRAVRLPAACSATMGVAVWLTARYLPTDWPAALNLACQVGWGIAVYALLVLLTKPAGYRDVAKLIASRRRHSTQSLEPLASTGGGT